MSWYYVSQDRHGESESRALLAFAAPLMVLAIGQAVLVNLDLLQIKAYFPQSDDVGFYSGMASLSRTPYFLFTAFSVTLLPLVTSALRTHGRERAGAFVARSTTFLLITALPVVAIMAAVPKPLLDFVFPLEYTAPRRRSSGPRSPRPCSRWSLLSPPPSPRTASPTSRWPCG